MDQVGSEAFEEGVQEVVGADAQTEVALGDGGNSITVSGTVRWSDRNGSTHALPSATVEIWDEDLIWDDLLATTTTDASGNYSATFAHVGGVLEGDPDIFVRVLARSPVADIKPDSSSASTYFMDSATTDEVPDHSSLTIDLTAGNTNDNETVFSLHHALAVIGSYAGGLASATPAQMDVRFPTTRSTSLYDSGAAQLHILRLDRWDWDVIHHEYGHCFQDIHGFENNPGGPHNFGDNLAQTRGSKDVGIRLAWGEGWPTFFAISGQNQTGAAALGVPNVGDVTYHDTEDATITLNLETSNGVGEDNEVSVMSALWDLFDSADDDADEVAISDQALFNAFKGAAVTTMGAAWEAIAASQPTEGKTEVGAVLGQANIASVLTAPADNFNVDPSDPPPDFTWQKNGGGTPNPLNDFRIRFYNDDFNSIVFEKELGDTDTFTPTSDEWDTIVEGDSELNWVVEGRNTSAPATPGGTLGRYWSDARKLNSQRLDLIFCIDTTGSMGDDIAAVKSASVDIINEIADSIPDYRIAVVDYRDFPVWPYGGGGDYPYHDVRSFTSDKTAAISGIQSLSLGWGADWPESVYSALMHSIDSTSLGGWRGEPVKKMIILMGDAPPHDPGPFTGYTMTDVIEAAENADPVVVFPVAIGSSPYYYFRTLAEGTGGKVFTAANASQVVDVIMEALEVITYSPYADAGGPYTGVVGSPITFDASGSYDPDGEIVLYEWDWDSDGVYDYSSTGPFAEHAWSVAFSDRIRMRVTDDDDLTSYDTADVEVTGGVPPTITDLSLDETVISEYDWVTLTGSFTDPNLLDEHTVVIDWDDGTINPFVLDLGAREFSHDHQYLDDGPSGTAWHDYTIAVTVSDDTGSDTATTTVTVNNVAPSVTVAPSSLSVQYSDYIADGDVITISTTDVPGDPLSAVAEYSDDGGGSFGPLPGWLSFSGSGTG
ncbi:MAG: PKD domain-containing protein, partial [Planctomycetota bacterium]